MPNQSMPVAAVTGASSGIGRALVSRLLSQGHCCVAADIDAPGQATLASEFGADSTQLATWRVDVSSAEDVDWMASFAFGRFGRVDLVINNAGILSTGLRWQTTAQQWRRMLDVNFFGVVHAVRSFEPRLIERGHGHIVNIGSF